MRRMFTIGAAVSCAIAMVFPLSAFAQRVWVEGTDARALSIASVDKTVFAEIRGDSGVALERTVLWEYRRPGAEPFEPFSGPPPCRPRQVPRPEPRIPTTHEVVGLHPAVKRGHKPHDRLVAEAVAKPVDGVEGDVLWHSPTG